MMQMTVQIVVVIISVTAKFACSFTIRRDVWLLIVSIPFVSNHSPPIGQDSRTLGHKSWLEREVFSAANYILGLKLKFLVLN